VVQTTGFFVPRPLRQTGNMFKMAFRNPNPAKDSLMAKRVLGPGAHTQGWPELEGAMTEMPGFSSNVHLAVGARRARSVDRKS
jgi:hypothetical protein